MQPRRTSTLIYGLLLGVWVLVVAWQVEEHVRVREEARAALVNRAKDISTTMGIVLRSQRRFGGVVSKERLEDSLKELANQEKTELSGIALLNEGGEVVASAGTAIDPANFTTLARAGTTENWGAQAVTLFTPVDLGTNLTRDIEGTNLPIVLSLQDITNRFGPPPPRSAQEPPQFENPTNAGPGRGMADGRGPPPPDFTNNPDRSRGGFRPRIGRPRWMSEQDYQAMLQKRGVHSFAIVMSAQPLHVAFDHDFWLRCMIIFFAGISSAGAGLALRNVSKTSELQIRLVRASELNSHLKEMNLAAAGLAHETRNPLNIIRGLSQMLSKQTDAPPDIREKTRVIMDETDKVTAQLTEFINYSRPREVRRSKVALNSAFAEVLRTLNHDLEEKKLRVETGGEQLSIEADEQLMRQVLFNLLINAIQAVNEGGQIQISAKRESATEASLEIRDDGAGVSPEQRQEIFKPYFTTHQKGTGLGLAIVSQIVLAHGWEIQCLANTPKGAIFRITHLKLAA
jgi:signal transduction histidine kinase